MEKSLVLNVSRLLPISGKVNDEMLLEIQSLLQCKISKKEFINYFKKKLNVPDLQVQAINNEKNEILVRFDSNFSLPEKDQIVKHVENFFSYEIGEKLTNKYTSRKIIYITKQSGIPLIGNLAFGILLHNTNVIEIRPVTGCPLQCIFCSVEEGKKSKLRIDYIVEPNYLIEEIQKIVNFLGPHDLEAHISAQGEPTIYPHLIDLVSKLSKLPGIEIISMQSNGIPLTESYVDALEKAGLTRINLSINTLNPKKARYLAGTPDYDVEHVKAIAKHITRSSIDLMITPIIIPGKNEQDIEEIIKFTNEVGAGKSCPPLGIQNYLIYQFGRKITNVELWNWKKFFSFLRDLEKKYEIKPLLLNKKDFYMHKRKNPPKSFKKGQIIDIKLSTYGRRNNQMLGVKSGRTIEIIKTNKKIGEKIKVKIIKTQRNIFVAEPI